MSDLIPTAANIPIVWLASYDLFPGTSLEEKERFLREVAEKRLHPVFRTRHFIPNAPRVEWAEKGPKVKEKFGF